MWETDWSEASLGVARAVKKLLQRSRQELAISELWSEGSGQGGWGGELESTDRRLNQCGSREADCPGMPGGSVVERLPLAPVEVLGSWD